MTPIGIESWTDLYVATAGASAALAGLVIVATSANVHQVMESVPLQRLAAASIGALAMILVTSVVGLIKAQPLAALGGEILLFGIGNWLLTLRYLRESVGAREKGKLTSRELVVVVVVNHIQVLPFLIGAVILLGGSVDGLYWVAAGIVAAFLLSLFNAWVLLIEILH